MYIHIMNLIIIMIIIMIIMIIIHARIHIYIYIYIYIEPASGVTGPQKGNRKRGTHKRSLLSHLKSVSKVTYK